MAAPLTACVCCRVGTIPHGGHCCFDGPAEAYQADDNDLCSQFEQFCDQFGWQGRVDDVEATVEVTVQVSVLVSDVPRMSRTPTVVEQRIDDDSVRERLREGNFSLRSTSISDRDRTNIASRGVLL